MKIRYIGKARIKVGDICSFEPGEEKDIEDLIGRELCRSGEFKALTSTSSVSGEGETASGRGKRGKKQAVATEAETDNESKKNIEA